MTSTSLLSTELNWLIGKKISYLTELQEFQSKTQQNVLKLIQLNQTLNAQNQKLTEEVERCKKTMEEMETNMDDEINKYRSILQKKQNEILEIKEILQAKQQLYNKTIQNLGQSQKCVRDLQLKVEELQNTLESKLKEKDQQISELTQKNNTNIENMIAKYQQIIEQKVTTIEKQYQDELEQIKTNNRAMIQELQSKSKQNLELNKEQVKKNSQDAERLIIENKKLLFQLNEGKRKILNLESQLEAARQELKIMTKEKEISGINGKRQIQCLKENKQELEMKIKALLQSMDENRWDAKQIQLQKEKQIKKIKEESEKIVDEVVVSYRSQIADFKSKIKDLKAEIQEHSKRCEELKKQRDVAQEIVSILKKEKQTAQLQKMQESKKSQNEATDDKNEVVKLKGMNSQLKKQILRKSAQVQVLKQEITRLKTKFNKVTVAYQENVKNQELMEKQNKMLLSEIVFLRDRNKSKLMSTQKKPERDNKNNSRMSNRILDVKSEQSEIMENQDGELQMYKELIVEMEKDMNQAVAKLDQKNNIIEKQRAIIERLERALNK